MTKNIKRSAAIFNSDEKDNLNESSNKTNGFNKLHHDNMNLSLCDYSKLNQMDNELCLIQLPKELLKHQREFLQLKLNLNDLKNGHKFNMLNNEYEASLSKAKVDFACLFKNGEADDTQFTPVNNFKYVIKVTRCIDLPPVQPPLSEMKKVEVPLVIDNYLRKQDKSFKKIIKEQLKSLMVTRSQKRKMTIKTEPCSEDEHILKNKRKKT